MIQFLSKQAKFYCTSMTIKIPRRSLRILVIRKKFPQYLVIFKNLTASTKVHD